MMKQQKNTVEVDVFSNPLRIGEAFALIEAHINENLNFRNFLISDVETIKLDEMLNLYQSYESGKIEMGAARVCSADAPLLQKHQLLMATHIIFDKSSPKNDAYHQPIIKHLNDCYWCFKYFSQVLRDYHRARKLIKSPTGV